MKEEVTSPVVRPVIGSSWLAEVRSAAPCWRVVVIVWTGKVRAVGEGVGRSWQGEQQEGY